MRRLWTQILGFLVLAFVGYTGYLRGIDANVYLYAASQLTEGVNFYADNPYNHYLYSPLFALLLSPLSMLDFSIARVIWALIQGVMAWRLFVIFQNIVRERSQEDRKMTRVWSIAVILLSVGFLTLNLNLGQITVLILYLTGEGLYQVLIRDRPVLGSGLLALGVMIKIIPLLAFVYIGSQWKIKASILGVAFLAAGVFLPSIFIGHQYNMEMHKEWLQKINPSGDKYILENHEGSFTHSLNAMIPAFIYDFEEPVEADQLYSRRVLSLPQDVVVMIVQGVRLILFLLLFWLYWHPRKLTMNSKVHFYWCFAALCLVTVLIFPHQQKYAQLYCVPAASYIFWRWLQVRREGMASSRKNIIKYAIPLVALLIIVLNGRDIVGHGVVNWLDYFHVQGWINLYFLWFLITTPPKHAGEAPLQISIAS